jgi:heavy metal sensor kinase
MPRSIRWRLQLWYAAVLAFVLAGFAGLLYNRARAARLRDVDARLEAAVLRLDADLRVMVDEADKGPPRRTGPGPQEGDDRPPPPWERDGLPPPPKDRGRPPPPWEKDGPPDRPPPRRPPPEDGRPERRPPPEGRSPPEGRPPPPTPATLAVPNDDGQTYFVVRDRNGVVIAPPGLSGELPPDGDPQPKAPPRIIDRGDRREAVALGPGGTRILVGRSIAHEQAELRVFAWWLFGGSLGVLAIGLVGGWLAATRAVRPIARISDTAAALSAANLSGRIDTHRIDTELANLAGVLNSLFDRLQASFERQSRFTADASHELRTPLAVLKTHAELALSRPRTPEEYQRTLETCLRAVGRLTAVVEALLTLARADGGWPGLQSRAVNLEQLAAETIGLFGPLAESRKVTLYSELQPLQVTGDVALLGQVLSNLVHNAIEYNRPGGEVRLRLQRVGPHAVLSVSDTGSGIPEADQPQVFERFYRADKARSRARGGTGLGLAICKDIVEAHGGVIDFESKVNEGTTFRVRLPLGP